MQRHVILEPNLTPTQVCELGLLAESVGLDGLWVQNYASGPDPFLTLAPLAAASRRLRLGIVVVSPQEAHPLRLATALLTLNEQAPGRVALALGRGGEWLGVMAGDFRPRIAPLREALEIVHQLARGAGCPGPFEYRGQTYESRFFRTPWVHATAPPQVYAAVTKDRMLAMAAAVADGVILADLGLPRVVAERRAVADAALAAAGRPRTDFKLCNFVGLHVKPERVAALAEARRELIIRAWLSPYWLQPFLTPDEVEFVQTNKRIFLKAYRQHSSDLPGIPDDLVAKLINGLTITGGSQDEDAIEARLRDFAAAGTDELALRIHDEPADTIRWLGGRRRKANS